MPSLNRRLSEECFVGPVILAAPTVYAFEGESISIPCAAMGATSIHWSRRDAAPMSALPSDSGLAFPSVSPDDSDAYICTAEFPSGKKLTRSVVLKVLGM